MVNFLYFYLGISVVAASFTNLRFIGPIGIGELIVLSCIPAVFVAASSVKKKHGIPRYHITITILGGLLVLLYAVSWNYGILHSVNSLTFGIRDFMAISFGYFWFVACLAFVSFTDTNREQLKLFYRGIAFSFFFVLLPLYLVSFFSPSVAGIQFWYHGIVGHKWTGLSNNPNQVALVCAFAFAVTLLGLRVAETKRQLMTAILFMIAVVVISLATKSSALIVSLIATLLMFGFMLLKKTQKISVIFISIACLSFIILIYLLNQNFAFALEEVLVGFIEGDGGQGDSRFNLWHNAYLAYLDSPLIGWGPGSFSGNYGPYDGREAHNLFIDMLSSVGAVGVLVFLSMVLIVLTYSLKNRSEAGVASIVCILAFAMFHYVIRSPIFWASILFALMHISYLNRGKAS